MLKLDVNMLSPGNIAGWRFVLSIWYCKLNRKNRSVVREPINSWTC